MSYPLNDEPNTHILSQARYIPYNEVMSFLEKLFGNNNTNPTVAAQSPAPAEATGPGAMVVNDVFSIKGRGTVVTGRVETGEFFLNQTVIITTANGQFQTVITGIETFHKTSDHAVAGQNVGLLLSGVEREAIDRGDHIQVA